MREEERRRGKRERDREGDKESSCEGKRGRGNGVISD